MHRSSTNYKPKQSETYSSKQMCRGFICERTTGNGLFSRGSVIMDDYYLDWYVSLNMP